MLLFVLAGIPLSWVGNELARRNTQREVVDRIRAAGGECYLDFQVDVEGFPNLDARQSQSLMRGLLGDDLFAFIEGADVHSRDALNIVSELPQVRFLNLSAEQLSDDSLETIGRLRSLEVLMTDRNHHITDRGTIHLRDLSKLRVLILNETQITNQGMNNFKRLERVECLVLSSPNLDDECLELVVSLPKLQVWDLGHSNITDQAVAEVLAYRPDLEIQRWRSKDGRRRVNLGPWMSPFHSPATSDCPSLIDISPARKQ